MTTQPTPPPPARPMLCVPDYATNQCYIGDFADALRQMAKGYKVVLERFPTWTFFVDARTADEAVAVVHRELDKDGIPYMSGKNGSTVQRLPFAELAT